MAGDRGPTHRKPLGQFARAQLPLPQHIQNRSSRRVGHSPVDAEVAAQSLRNHTVTEYRQGWCRGQPKSKMNAVHHGVSARSPPVHCCRRHARRPSCRTTSRPPSGPRSPRKEIGHVGHCHLPCLGRHFRRRPLPLCPLLSTERSPVPSGDPAGRPAREEPGDTGSFDRGVQRDRRERQRARARRALGAGVCDRPRAREHQPLREGGGPHHPNVSGPYVTPGALLQRALLRQEQAGLRGAGAARIHERPAVPARHAHLASAGQHRADRPAPDRVP